ncbi:MAG: hypothetical protein F4X44_12570 [Gammaproteobacteria bacterium]|nr:hypothetical protein [Gammaproteobacteria bacterium]MYD81430.1 hypothetical protein [Gammaproteobacteria bacterium]
MHKLKLLLASVVLVTSTTVFGDIAGTYVLDQDEDGSNEDARWSMTLAVDDDGNYSATVTTLKDELKAESVEVDGKEFSFSITREDANSEYKVLYSGTVENGKMSGSFAIGEGKMFFSATLKEEEPDEAPEEDANETDEDDAEI